MAIYAQKYLGKSGGVLGRCIKQQEIGSHLGDGKGMTIHLQCHYDIGGVPVLVLHDHIDERNRKKVLKN